MTSGDGTGLPVKKWPRDYEKFRRRLRPRFMRYAQQRLHSRAAAEAVVEHGLMQVLAVWPEIAVAGDPEGEAWEVMVLRVEDHRRTHSSGTGLPTPSVPEGEQQRPPAPGRHLWQEQAFSDFFRTHRPGYVRYAERSLGSFTEAEDAIDQGFEQVYQQWPEISAKNNPAAYVWGLMKHRIIDQARARDRRTRLLEAAVFETVAMDLCPDPVAELESNMRLAAAVRQLSERQIEVIFFLYYEGYGTQETAEVLGISPAGVRSTERYAKISLRRIYEKGEADDRH